MCRPACVLDVVVILLALPVTAQAKSYYIDNTMIAADVRTDGSMHVREERTFVFRGDFRAVDRFIDVPAGAEVRNVVVTEGNRTYREAPGESPGTFHLKTSGRRLQITWGYSARDETRTFALDFDVIGAIRKHADVAELYWQFVGQEWSVTSEETRVTVNLPSGALEANTRAWAHGPLWGEIHIAEGRVTFTCDPLPANEMLEGRILFPTAAIASSPRHDNVQALPSILQEEGGWAEQANARRQHAKARVALQWGLPSVAIVVGVCLWLALYLKYGRELHDEAVPEYLRDPPEDWTPNEVAFVWRWGELNAQDMTATLMDLVRRGALRLIVTSERREILGGLLGETTVQEYIIERVRDGEARLSDAERYLVNGILFHDITGDRVSLKAFQQNARAKPRAAYHRFKTWRGMAKREAKRFEVVDPTSKAMCAVGASVGFAMLVGSIILAAAMQSPTFVASAILGFALLPGSFAILRRSREAARHLRRWQAFRRYLTDFSRLSEYPPPAVVLWEQYLVYAITLGVADEVIEQFKHLYPQLEESVRGTQVFPHWVNAGGETLAGMDSIGSVLSSFSSTLATATSSMSSSSGSGGGFSGGGGGGGGGSGGGGGGGGAR